MPPRFNYDVIRIGVKKWYSIRARKEHDQRAGSRLRHSLDVQDQDVSVIPLDAMPKGGLGDAQVRIPGVRCGTSEQKERHLPCPSQWKLLKFGAATLRRTGSEIDEAKDKTLIGAELRPQREARTEEAWGWPLNRRWDPSARFNASPPWAMRPLAQELRSWKLAHLARQYTIARYITENDADLWARMNTWANTPERILGPGANRRDWEQARDESPSKNDLDLLQAKLGGANGVTCASRCVLQQRGAAPEEAGRIEHSSAFPWDVSAYHTHGGGFGGFSIDVCIQAEFRCKEVKYAIVGLPGPGRRSPTGEWLAPPPNTPEDRARLDRWPHGEPFYGSRRRETRVGAPAGINARAYETQGPSWADRPPFDWPRPGGSRWPPPGASLAVWTPNPVPGACGCADPCDCRRSQLSERGSLSPGVISESSVSSRVGEFGPESVSLRFSPPQSSVPSGQSNLGATSQD